MRGDLERILDMIEMCDLLLMHASDPATLERDAVVQAAAQRWIEVLGEAASRISEELKGATPEIPVEGDRRYSGNSRPCLLPQRSGHRQRSDHR